MIERRKGAFPEKLSLFVVLIAGLGAFGVLLDPVATLTILGQTVKIGGEGFSAELKGAVITIMLIGGWTAVMNFWLGSSDQGQKQAQSISRIAEQASPAQAAAVAAAAGSTVSTTSVSSTEVKP